MVTPLGVVFRLTAYAPLARANQRFARNLIGDGVRRLEAEGLRRALAAGTDAVAERSDLPPALVRSIVTRGAFDTIAASLSNTQPRAMGAIRHNDLTITPFSVPPASEAASVHLDGFAAHFNADTAIATALRDLARDVARWEAALDAALARVDSDERLAAGVRRKRRSRVAFLSATLLVALGAAGAGAWVAIRERDARAWSERAAAAERNAALEASAHVDRVLTAGDPCDRPELSDDDLARASAEQRARLRGRRAQCEQQAVRRARVELCERVTRAVDAKQPASFAGELTPDEDALVGRLARRTLVPDDLRVTAVEMPCAEAPSARAMWAALASAAREPALWGASTGVSSEVARALHERGDPVDTGMRRTLSYHAEELAKRALKRGEPAMMNGAREVCAFKRGVPITLGFACQSLLALP